MPTETATAKEFIQDYFKVLSGNPKTDELSARYVSDPKLLEHIRDTEAGFPSYQIVGEQFVGEGDTVAVRATFSGTHTGPFFGMPPTGRHVSATVMLFYRVADGRIVQHWMLIDTHALMAQLTS